MKEKAITVEFRIPPTKTTPKPPPGAKAERQRQERAARKARNLALAYYIDSLIRSGKVADLAAVAHLCGVSRARVSKVVSLLEMAVAAQEQLIANTRLIRWNACSPSTVEVGGQATWGGDPQSDNAGGGGSNGAGSAPLVDNPLL